MKTDIQDRRDIELLMNSFYDKVKLNPVIGHFFSEVIPVNWEKHLPIMYDFWENIVFASGTYSGNPMVAHKKLHGLHAFSKSDFEEWLKVFKQTVDELFEGEKAELIKQRAQSIATVMQLKIIHNDNFSL